MLKNRFRFVYNQDSRTSARAACTRRQTGREAYRKQEELQAQKPAESEEHNGGKDVDEGGGAAGRQHGGTEGFRSACAGARTGSGADQSHHDLRQRYPVHLQRAHRERAGHGGRP